jgi:Fe-Mn family superoxide dismutase
MDRRKFLVGTGAVGAAILAARHSAAELFAAATPNKFQMQSNPSVEEQHVPFTLPPLPYGYDALEPSIDTLTMTIHHDKHHAAYVNNLNKALEPYPDLQSKTLEQLLSSLDTLPDAIKNPVRNNAGGHWNHSFFWPIMKVNNGAGPAGALATAINAAFGDFPTFKTKLAAAGAGRFGSGWAWLLVKGGKLVIDSTPNQDTPLSLGGTAVIGVDVWEHAYYLKYQNRRPDYIDAWWSVVNWDAAAKNYAAAMS